MEVTVIIAHFLFSLLSLLSANKDVSLKKQKKKLGQQSKSSNFNSSVHTLLHPNKVSDFIQIYGIVCEV